jgi:hypothetical protein
MKKDMNDRLEEEIKCELHQHRVRSEVLKESSKTLDQQMINAKKETKLRESRNKKELKEAKREELKRIENAIR